MTQVITQSGVLGWRGKLQSSYSNMQEFIEYDEIFNLAGRLGYDDPVKCWDDNPIVEGSVNPSDFRIVGTARAAVVSL